MKGIDAQTRRIARKHRLQLLSDAFADLSGQAISTDTAPGFGFLVPKKERQRLAACTFVGTKFSYRVPDDKIALRCFFGGIGDAAILNEIG